MNLLLALAAVSANAFVPSPYLNFEATPTQITHGCEDAKKRAESTLQGIVVMPEVSRTFANTPEALETALWDLSDSQASNTFLKNVAVSSTVRAAAHDCESMLAQFGVEVFSREDLYKAVLEYAAKGETLTGEPKKLLEKELLDFKRSGLALDPSKRAEVKKIRKRLVELELQFGKNLNEVKDFLVVSRTELEGLPEDYVARLKREGEGYKITLDYPDYFPFMNNAKDPEARRKLELLYNNRAKKENLPILKEVLALRRRAARLLGYPTHAHYVLEERMAKSPERVSEFISRLEGRLKKLAHKELAVLKELKAAEHGKKAAKKINAWEWRYYDNKLKKERHQLDLEEIKTYFPVEKVTEGLLSIYQELLGVKFRRLEKAVAWHPDVKLYEITDSQDGSVRGYFYMDLFPREGKYKHAAAFDLVKGRRLADGSYQPPVSSMVCNFNNLLKHGEHEEVETYFHEFGHIMHQTLTRARYGRFSGSSTARDFVEAPSQMLENWVWDPKLLSRMTIKPLPEDLLKRMIAAKNVNTGLVNLRQLFFGTIDQLYHLDPPSDTTAAYARLMKRITLFPMSAGAHPEASFGHLMGYDAGYYGYMWSRVFAEDMASKFLAEGLLNPVTGRRYRETILERGSSRDEAELLRDFLGREPNEEAFLKSLGI
jgi:thimet oligopeptidase